MTRRPSRRLVGAGFLAMIAGSALAGTDAQDSVAFQYRGFTVDLTASASFRRDVLAAYIREQIDLVESLAIRSDIKAWFRSVRVTVDPELNMPGRFAEGRLTLDDTTSARDNPVLLHELLHGYMADRLRPTGELRRFYEEAQASEVWPLGSYMVSNINEFFAMTASVALWGRAARPPFTREQLEARMPDYFDWLRTEFGLKG